MSQNPNSGIKIFFSSRIAKTILFSLIGFVVAILLLEISASIYNSIPKWFDRVETDNVSQVVFNKDALKFHFYSFQTIPYYISKNFNEKKNKEVKRVFIIGDASVAGWPYTENQSVSKKVELTLTHLKLLNRFELIPVNFAGLNSSHALDLLQEIKEYEPDLVIIFLGHNEFYTHEDLTIQSVKFHSNLVDVINQFFFATGIKEAITYDSSIDDLESLLPVALSNPPIIEKDLNYNAAIETFSNNISQIAEICKKEGINLLLPVSSDNLLSPPIGIVQHTPELQADIIFSNARMAIYRDGDIKKAKELFIKAKELDAIKFRMPNDLTSTYEQLIIDKSTLVRIDSLFEINSENNIPSSKLFLDYIHPNNTGLNIIATIITKKIIEKLSKEVEVDSIKSFVESALLTTTKDSIIAEYRLQNTINSLIEKKL